MTTKITATSNTGRIAAVGTLSALMRLALDDLERTLAGGAGVHRTWATGRCGGPAPGRPVCLGVPRRRDDDPVGDRPRLSGRLGEAGAHRRGGADRLIAVNRCRVGQVETALGLLGIDPGTAQDAADRITKLLVGSANAFRQAVRPLTASRRRREGSTGGGGNIIPALAEAGI